MGSGMHTAGGSNLYQSVWRTLISVREHCRHSHVTEFGVIVCYG